MEATEDELAMDREYRQSLKSTVKKKRPQESPTGTKQQKNGFKTPAMKRPQAQWQPIL